MNTITHTIVLLLLTGAALGLSGCAQSKDETAPAPSTTQAPPATTAKPAPTTTPAPAKPGPGQAHFGNYTYKSDSNIAQGTFKVNESWTNLHINMQMFKSAQCGVLQAEPPAGTGTGPQPQVTFTSPSGQKIGPIALGTYSSCDVNVHNKVGTTPSPTIANSEEGTWKIDIHGRGVNVYLQVSVIGT